MSENHLFPLRLGRDGPWPFWPWIIPEEIHGLSGHVSQNCPRKIKIGNRRSRGVPHRPSARRVPRAVDREVRQGVDGGWPCDGRRASEVGPCGPGEGGSSGEGVAGLEGPAGADVLYSTSNCVELAETVTVRTAEARTAPSAYSPAQPSAPQCTPPARPAHPHDCPQLPQRRSSTSRSRMSTGTASRRVLHQSSEYARKATATASPMPTIAQS